MRICFDPNQPIYTQIMADIKQLLISGELPPGAKIPSVRDLAQEYGVNPNTMQKALSELEREGYLAAERGIGRSATRDLAVIDRLREDAISCEIRRFISRMAQLGLSQAELSAKLAEFENHGRDGLL
jgi:DNA-binding transcriptional regulator YhcF (GntR family)